jgi:hypothetical protein
MDRGTNELLDVGESRERAGELNTDR